MKQITNDEIFIGVVGRINKYLILISMFYLLYFLLKTKVDTFLFLLALSYAAFALLSYKHLTITNRLAVELQRAKATLDDVSRETRQMHPDRNA